MFEQVHSDLLDRVHNANFYLLKQFDKICSDNGINYFLDSGTLLGAVRHQDFIPWDDDVDVIVFASDYSRLMDVLRKKLPDDIELVEYTDYKDYFLDFIDCITLKDTVLRSDKYIEDDYLQKRNRVSLDLFILEDASVFSLYSTIKIAMRKVIYGLAMGRRKKIDYIKYSWIELIVIFILASFGKLLPLNIIYFLHRWTINKRKPVSDTNCLCVNHLFLQLSCVFRFAWFSKPGIGVIRGNEFPIPNNYDSVLTKMYGKYMEYPPEEKRIPFHVSETTIIPDKFS